MLDLAAAVTTVLLAVGGLFCLLAALGIVILTDVYTRMQAASKAVTLGATCIMLAVATHFQDAATVARCVLVCLFLFATVPVGTHLIARAAHRSREPLAPETVLDEFVETPRKEP